MELFPAPIWSVEQRALLTALAVAVRARRQLRASEGLVARYAARSKHGATGCERNGDRVAGREYTRTHDELAKLHPRKRVDAEPVDGREQLRGDANLHRKWQVFDGSRGMRHKLEH